MAIPTTTASRALPKANDPCWCGSGRKFKRCHKASTEHIRPGRVSPPRPVPDEIARPPYADTGVPVRHPGPHVRTPEVIERMRRAGRAAAEILRTVGAAVAPGVTTDELDALCHEECIRRGGYPSPLNYGAFPKSLCTSINEVICHGIPDDRALVDGDIVNLDVTIFLDGVHGDTNATFPVGTIDAASADLVRVTRECLERGIAAVRPGRPIRDIGRAIQSHAEGHGYGVVRAFVGHGIAEQFHTDLQVPHYDDPRATTIIEPGMTFTIEPMITMGSWQHEIWSDGWTAVTADRRRTAQFEHTLLVTDDGAGILTLPD
ncbi:MAG TPA: type I methionyl aminopeptidase [Acidimicrobiales bacterium]|jgi:methionyl aminopeptidase|nr:type I methionyl aminopeptidase [Acidimicrobiales bacterium]